MILYDRLIPAAALDGARADAELLFVGKEGGGESVPQEQTEALLIARAQAGQRVVRLKGGDPFVFGRGGEEALALRAAGIDFEVVPGVTAGVAASAYAGIPVTHRGLASAVASSPGTRIRRRTRRRSTGRRSRPSRARSSSTWACASCHAIAAAADRRRDDRRCEPAAVVERGTLPEQRTVTGTLATIAERAHARASGRPRSRSSGAVAALAERLAWLAPRPLAGRTVAVTRARAQASGLARRLRELGARVVQAPAIRIRLCAGPPLDPCRLTT